MVARPAPRPLLTMLIHNHHFYTGVQEELGGLFPVELRMAFITTSTYTDYRRGVQPFYVVIRVGFNSFLAEQMKVAGRSGSDTVSLVRVEQTRVAFFVPTETDGSATSILTRMASISTSSQACG